MAREYLKAIIENTVMEEENNQAEILDTCESSEDLDIETVPEENTNSMSVRSPDGPFRGRSVEEVEEQLANLKKENFHLKLRIYFLEERMGSNFNLDKEDVVRKNVKLMVEVESLRKEVQEKHDLLCQAVKAMELEDEEHKKFINEKEETIGKYQEEIEKLNAQLLDLRSEHALNSSKTCQCDAANPVPSQTCNVPTADAIKELRGTIHSLEEELSQEKGNSFAVQMVLDRSESRLRELAVRLEEATATLSARESDLKELTARLEESRSVCQGLRTEAQERSRLADALAAENEELRRRCATATADCERERKRLERCKAAGEQKTCDLQSKLEAALSELKKSQELVVSSNPSPAGRARNTHADSFSVQKPAAPAGSPKKDAFIPVSVASPLAVQSPPPSPSSSASSSLVAAVDPDDGVDLRQLIEQLKTERERQQQKIVKLKAEQMKACNIIKSMIDSRNRTEEEMATLRERNEALEKEAEAVGQRRGARNEVPRVKTSS